MAHWWSPYRLFAVAFVALSCPGRDAHAFTLCDGCPDLFASTSPAQQTAPAEPRAQGTRPHDRSVSRRRHQGHDDSSSLSLARRTALTAFAAVPTGRGATANFSVAITDWAPPVADAATSATPAFRIDELFNMLAAGASDQPEEVAALRTGVLSQFRMRQTSPDHPDEGTGFLVPTLIAFAGGLLIGAVLISARSHVIALPRIPGRQPSRPKLLSDRARQLTRRLSGNSLKGSPASPGVRERVTGLLNQTGSTPTGAWPRWGDERSRAYPRRPGPPAPLADLKDIEQHLSRNTLDSVVTDLAMHPFEAQQPRFDLL